MAVLAPHHPRQFSPTAGWVPSRNRVGRVLGGRAGGQMADAGSIRAVRGPASSIVASQRRPRKEGGPGTRGLRAFASVDETEFDTRETEDPAALLKEIEDYVVAVIDFLETNIEKSVLG